MRYIDWIDVFFITEIGQNAILHYIKYFRIAKTIFLLIHMR